MAAPPRAHAATVAAPRGLPLLPEQIAAGLLAAVAMTIADVGRALLAPQGARVQPGEVAVASLHLLACYLPLGLAAGVLFAALGGLLRATPAFTPVRERLALRALFRRDPEGFATGVGAIATLAVLAFASRQVFDVLVIRVHRMDLAAWAMGGLAIVILAAGLLVGASVRIVLLPLARRAGPLPSTGLLVLVLVGALAAVAGTALRPAYRDITNAYGIAPLVWGPVAVLVHALMVLALRTLALRRPRLAARGLAVVLASVALTSGVWTASGLSYGASNRVRGFVEQRSVVGRRAMRRFAAFTDLDRDGHSWAFGGRDCDDLDATVHPGALDEPGDGIDADCFAGDGAPEVEALSDGRFAVLPPAVPRRPNIVLVTIDALRPDHLGTFGYARDTSPNIDAFAADAVRFPTTLAQSSRSIRSIPAMMTGRYPSQIAYGPEYLYPALLPENETVAEVLAAHGYQTAVTMGTDYFHRTGGFFQGFADVQEILSYKPPRERAVDQALRQLETLSADPRPFFLWVHIFGVHGGYLDPPAPSRFGDAEVDRYDTEIFLADQQFQRLLDALDAGGHRDDTVVVLASDHGEAFLEHGQTGHASTLYDEELLSTLIVRVPGIAPRVVDVPVGLFDLGPTLLNLTGTRYAQPIPARSLVPHMLAQPDALDPERLFFAELMPDGLFPYDVKAIRRGDLKLLWWVQEGTLHLFDLAADPAEREDLADARDEDALELLGLLQAWVALSNRPENRTERFVAEHRLSAPPARMTHPLGIRYPGLFTVLGCDLPRTELSPGQTLDLTCYYRVDGETDLDFFFRVMLEGPPGVRVPPHFHAMHYPLHGRYRTHQWRAGEILADPTPIVVPPDIAVPVDLRLTFAIHVRGEGLQGFSQAGRTGHAATIDTIRIRAPAR